MKNQIPQDFTLKGHARPMAYVRENYAGQGVKFVSDSVRNVDDMLALSDWLKEAAKWCSEETGVQLNKDDTSKETLPDDKESVVTQDKRATRSRRKRKA